MPHSQRPYISPYLSVINVSNGSNVDVRLAALEDSGISSNQLLLAPSVQCALHWVDVLCAQSTRCAQESGSERHDFHTREQHAPTKGKGIGCKKVDG